MPVRMRERSSKLRALERDEDFRREIGLNPEQAAWESAYRELKSILALRSDKPFACRAVLFYRARKAASMSPDRWQQGSCIVEADRIRCVSVLPIPTHPDQCFWDVSLPSRRRFRLNFLVSRFRIDGNHELWCDPLNDEEWADRVIQRDATKQPIADHPKFTIRSYDPYGGLGIKADPVIKAPVAGRFKLKSNELHVTLEINGVPVVRFDPADVKDMETHAVDSSLAKPGSYVRQGTPLVRLVSSAKEYAQVRWRDRRNVTPEMDIAKGDFLSGTRERPLVAMAAKMMSQMARFSQSDDWDDHTPFKQWAPRHLLEWDTETLDSLVSNTPVSAWRGLEDEATLALGPVPKGTPEADVFCIRADDFAEAPFKRIEELAGYNVAHFGEDEEVILPKSAVLREGITEGTLVKRGDAVADYVPRTHYGWEDIVKLPQISYILRELANYLTVRPGQDGYKGSHALFPSDLTPNAWERECVVQGHYLDFRSSSKYLKGNVVMGPPWEQAWQKEWQRHVRDVGYNFEPVGNSFLDGKPMSFA
jgi:hypothetical protein